MIEVISQDGISSASFLPGEGRGASLRHAATQPIRVCYLIDDLGTGGTEGQLLSLIRHLDRQRFAPILCLLRGASARSRAMEPGNCPVIRLGVGSLRHPATASKLFRFARFLRRERVDVLQVYFPDSTCFGTVAAQVTRAPGVLCTRVNLAPARKGTQAWLSRLCHRLADGTIANSMATRAAALQHDGARLPTLHVIENGVEMTRFERLPGLETRVREGRLDRVGLVANLRPVKDPASFVRAASTVCALHRKASFHLAGEGELRPGLERLCADLGIQDRVTFLGDVRDIPGFLAGIDIAVLCSLSEGFSNALLEYMAAGRAIVATAVGGNEQLIRDGVNGLLVPPGAPAELARALRFLLEHPEAALRLGNAAKQDARCRHDAADRARRFEELYVDLGKRIGR